MLGDDLRYFPMATTDSSRRVREIEWNGYMGMLKIDMVFEAISNLVGTIPEYCGVDWSYMEWFGYYLLLSIEKLDDMEEVSHEVFKNSFISVRYSSKVQYPWLEGMTLGRTLRQSADPKALNSLSSFLIRELHPKQAIYRLRFLAADEQSVPAVAYLERPYCVRVRLWRDQRHHPPLGNSPLFKDSVELIGNQSAIFSSKQQPSSAALDEMLRRRGKEDV